VYIYAYERVRTYVIIIVRCYRSIPITFQLLYNHHIEKRRGEKKKRTYIHSLSFVLSRFALEREREKVKIQTIVQCIIIIIIIIVVVQQQKIVIMRHLFKKWASNNQLMTTSTNDNNNSIATTIYHQRVPIIEEEEFDNDDEGSFCSIVVSLYIREAFPCVH
jgi:predicted membrane protein